MKITCFHSNLALCALGKNRQEGEKDGERGIEGGRKAGKGRRMEGG